MGSVWSILPASFGQIWPKALQWAMAFSSLGYSFLLGDLQESLQTPEPVSGEAFVLEDRGIELNHLQLVRIASL